MYVISDYLMGLFILSEEKNIYRKNVKCHFVAFLYYSVLET